MYRILLERGAEKDLARLSSEIHDRVIAAIQALATNPRPPGCRKLAGSKHDWRIRVGDYRVVYEIADQIRVVRVNRVRHRREVCPLPDMKITGDVRKYAAEQGIAEEEALKKGMEEKSKEFTEKGSEL